MIYIHTTFEEDTIMRGAVRFGFAEACRGVDGMASCTVPANDCPLPMVSKHRAPELLNDGKKQQQ